MQINRNTNPEPLRLEILWEGYKKIKRTKGIVSTIKRINGIGDLLIMIIGTEQTPQINRQNVLKILQSTLMSTESMTHQKKINLFQVLA